MNREDLHTDAENYDVFCERCQRVHKKYPMTREGFDSVIKESAKNLADAIDAKAMEYAYASQK